jgi:hypothetical protein
MIVRTEWTPFLLLVLLDINHDVSTCFPQNSHIFCGGKTLIGRQREAGIQGGRSLVMHEEPPRHTVTFS